MEIVLLIIVGFMLFLFHNDSKGKTNWLQLKIDRLEKKVELLQQEIDSFKQAHQPSEVTMQAEVETETEAIICHQAETPAIQPCGQILPEQEQVIPYSPPEPVEQPEVTFPLSGTESAPIITTDVATLPNKTATQPLKSNPIWQWLINGNPMLKIGVVILFLGLAFLLRFASEHFTFSVESRYFSVAAIGIACGVIGWKLRRHYREYALTMQGASIAILYLTVLATLKLHSLLPPLLVLGTQVVLVVLMIFLALLQDARILAQVAVLGGLAAPVLISDGSGNYIGLFTYLSLLNAGVAAVAWFKSWRSLNLIAATGTFAIATAWGITSYKTEYFTACQIFLIFHTALYTFIVWRFARHKVALGGQTNISIDNNANLKRVISQWLQNLLHIGILDSGLLFGVAFSAFGLQAGMSYSWQDGVMWSAFAFAAFYGISGYWILRRSPELKLVAEAMLFLALVFITLAIGNGFNGWYKVTLWAIEALLIYQFGVRQYSPISRLFAIALFVASWLLYYDYLLDLADYSLINSLFFAFAGFLFYVAWALQRKGECAIWEQRGAEILLIIALYLSFMIPFYEYQIERLSSVQSAVVSLIVLLIAAIVQWWRENVILALFSVLGLIMTIFLYKPYSPIMLLGYLTIIAGTTSWCLHKPKRVTNKLPLICKIGGYINLIIAICALYLTLGDIADYLGIKNLEEYYRLLLTFIVLILLAYYLAWREAGIVALSFLPIWLLIFISDGFSHIETDQLIYYFAVYIAATLLHGLILHIQRPYIKQSLRLYWHSLGLIIFTLSFTQLLLNVVELYEPTSGWQITIPAIAPILAITLILRYQQQIRQRQLEKSYLEIGGAILIAALCSWAVLGNIYSSAQASPLPYIPLLNPLELASVAVAYLLWQWHKASGSAVSDKFIMLGLGGFGLFMLSVTTMRMWHHYTGIEWRFDSLMRSFSVQASLSVIWTISAIALMLQGHKYSKRTLWLIGAGLIAIVVAKLFLVELSDRGGIARIVSFIVVGILLLLVGYFAPLPPKPQKQPIEKQAVETEEEIS